MNEGAQAMFISEFATDSKERGEREERVCGIEENEKIFRQLP